MKQDHRANTTTLLSQQQSNSASVIQVIGVEIVYSTNGADI
jgi:hypothetical protein